MQRASKIPPESATREQTEKNGCAMYMGRNIMRMSQSFALTHTHTHKHIYSQSFSSSSREHLAFKLPPICLLHDTVIWPKYHFIHITWNRSWFEATVQCTHTYTMFRARWQTSLKCCGMTMCIPCVFFRLFSSVFLCVIRDWHVLFSLPLFPCFRAFAAFVLSLCHCNIMKTNIHEPRTYTAKRIYG